MTDQLHDLLTRIADQAGAGPNDPTLWDRARRARRGQRRLRAAAVAALVAAVLAGLTLAGVEPSRRSAPPLVERPDTGEPGIPSRIHGVPGDGGLDLESDLAIGQASVAIANPVGAYVVTAADGVYHRLLLPGFDPNRFRAGLAGMALSPDGRQLVWSWHGARRPGQDERRYAWGLRVADLTTGDVRTVRVGTSFNPGLHSNPRWSPDSRHVVSDQLFGVDLDAIWPPRPGSTVERWGVLLDTSRLRLTEMFGSYGDGDLGDPWVVSPAGRAYRVVADRLLTWEVDRGQTIGARSTIAEGMSGPSTGRFSPDGTWLMLSGNDLSGRLVLLQVGSAPAALTVPLAADDYPFGAATDLLGWTGERQLLAWVRRATGPSTLGADADLAVLTLVPGPAGAAETRLEVVGRLSGTGGETAVSVATDLATTERPTRAFDAPPFADDPAEQPTTGSTGRAARPEPEDDGLSVTARTALFGSAVLALLAAFGLAVAARRRELLHRQ